MKNTDPEFDEWFENHLVENLTATNKNMTNSKLDFLTSMRFWAMVVGALSIYLQMKGLIGEAEMQLIATVMGGFVVVKTVDKNMGEAKQVTTVSMPEGVSSVNASTGV